VHVRAHADRRHVVDERAVVSDAVLGLARGDVDARGRDLELADVLVDGLAGEVEADPGHILDGFAIRVYLKVS